MRCYVAVNFHKHADAFKRVDVPAQPDMRLVRRYHLTLQFWPDLPPQQFDSVSTSVLTFVYTPFDVVLDWLVAFPTKEQPELYALMPGNDGALATLRDSFIEHTLHCAPFDKEFTPHVTLLRKEKLTTGREDGRALVHKVNDISVVVDNIGLFESHPEHGMESYAAPTVNYFSG